jgi:hypothetical protein
MLKMGIQGDGFSACDQAHGTSGNKPLYFLLGGITLRNKKNMSVTNGLYELNV